MRKKNVRNFQCQEREQFHVYPNQFGLGAGGKAGTSQRSGGINLRAKSVVPCNWWDRKDGVQFQWLNFDLFRRNDAFSRQALDKWAPYRVSLNYVSWNTQNRELEWKCTLLRAENSYMLAFYLIKKKARSWALWHEWNRILHVWKFPANEIEFVLGRICSGFRAEFSSAYVIGFLCELIIVYKLFPIIL